MTIDELIATLTEYREKMGGDTVVKVAVDWKTPDIEEVRVNRYSYAGSWPKKVYEELLIDPHFNLNY